MKLYYTIAALLIIYQNYFLIYSFSFTIQHHKDTTIMRQRRRTSSSSSSSLLLLPSIPLSSKPITTTTKLYQTPSLPSFEELNQQKSEALTSLSSFHDGTWINFNGALSFSITSDVTAGICNKIYSPPYKTTISTRLGIGGSSSSGSSGSNNNGEVLKLVETLSWDQPNQMDQRRDDDDSVTQSTIITNDNNNTNAIIGNTFFGRACPLGNTMDIDSVDGSYSLHSNNYFLETNDIDNNDDNNNNIMIDKENKTKSNNNNISSSSSSSSSCALPMAISGIDNKIVTSIVEHCLVTNENERCRCFLLYSKTGLYGNGSNSNDDQSKQEERLVRVVICDERKVVDVDSNKVDLLQLAEEEKSSQMGDSRLDQLAAAMGNPTLQNQIMDRCPVSLMTLSLGPWLGDSVIRDKSYNDLLPTSPTKSSNKGFGTPKKVSTSQNQQGGGFAEWVIGVQKVAMEYKWDYGSTVRHCLEFGKSMGIYCENWPLSSTGTIFEERMSRRLSPEERTVYIDYDMGSYCGFVVGSVYVKVSVYYIINK